MRESNTKFIKKKNREYLCLLFQVLKMENVFFI